MTAAISLHYHRSKPSLYPSLRLSFLLSFLRPPYLFLQHYSRPHRPIYFLVCQTLSRSPSPSLSLSLSLFSQETPSLAMSYSKWRSSAQLVGGPLSLLAKTKPHWQNYGTHAYTKLVRTNDLAAMLDKKPRWRMSETLGHLT